MNIGDGIACISIFVGTVGLLFVAFVIIRSEFLKQYFVHWEDKEGNHFYSMIEACSENGAAQKTYKSNPNVTWVNKIVRDTRIAR